MRRCLFLWPACLAALFLAASGHEAFAAQLVIVGQVSYSGPTITGGNFINPGPIGAASTTGNGFSTGGNYSFTADGGPAAISYTATENFRVTTDPSQLGTTGYLPPGDNYFLFASVDGTFSDPGNPNAQLTQFTNETDLSVNGSPFQSVTAGAPPADGPPVSIGGPTGILADPEEIALASVGPFSLTDGESLTLQQTTTMAFANLNQGDNVFVDLPNGSNVGPAPEPASLTLLGGMGVLGLAGYGWRRLRGRA